MEEHLEELERLVDTAGGVVVGEMVQKLDRPNPATYLGKGKLDELGEKIRELKATLLIFDDELSPSQGKNIEDTTGVRVMDRAELILDIFATRARSNEAKMQVELAQLEYLLPRLTRMWAHLEKFRGGIGVRGPGETQLETDRRLIGHRIKTLKARLQTAQKARDVQRGNRYGSFRASLVGYTNAGKSSLLRALAGDKSVFVEDRLFATLDTLTRKVRLDVEPNYTNNNGNGSHKPEYALVTDTVGFIRKLPHNLVASFRATLEETTQADVLLHVIDASNPVWEDQLNTVNEVLAELGVIDKPIIHVFNKTDALSPEDLQALEERVAEIYPGSVLVSALKPGGVDSLRKKLRALASVSLQPHRPTHLSQL